MFVITMQLCVLLFNMRTRTRLIGVIRIVGVPMQLTGFCPEKALSVGNRLFRCQYSYSLG